MKPDAPTQSQARLAYLYSRYPVVSQTFCDSEMLALEARGFDLDIASLNPPPNAFRHERFEDLRAEVFYPPPPAVLAALKARHEKDGTWAERFGDLVAPQSFTVACDTSHGCSPAQVGKIPESHLIFGGDDWWFFGLCK